MAFDAYLEIDGIPGESTDGGHKDWVEIKDYSHNINQPMSGSASSGGGRSSERANHGVFQITKELDKASPKLSLCCCNGENISKVTIELCRAGGDKQKYMTYEMEDVVVQSIGPQGNPNGDGNLPLESVAFAYGKITWTYTQLDGKSGKPVGDVSSHWDQTENMGG